MSSANNSVISPNTAQTKVTVLTVVKATPLTLSVQITLSVWIVKQQGIHLFQGTAQNTLKWNLFSKMKFLQCNISSYSPLLNQLWCNQWKNNYNTIFLQETNYKDENLLGNFKHWKVRMHIVFFKNKSLRFGVGTLLPPSVKNVFKDNLSRDDL